MFSAEIHQLINEEKIKDLRREAERQQLIKVAMLHQPDSRVPVRRMAGWFGFQLVKWGLKLQHYSQGQRQTVIQRGS